VEGTTTLTGDVITLHNRTRIHAVGHVHLTDLDSQIVAKEGTLDLTTEEATLYHAKVYAFDRSYYLTGTNSKRPSGSTIVPRMRYSPIAPVTAIIPIGASPPKR
jgi:hypothetical protein